MKNLSLPALLSPLALSCIGYSQEAPPAHKAMPPFTAATTSVKLSTRSIVTFKAFQPSEFFKVDSRGIKTPIKAGETVTLSNGKSVKIEDYVASTNALEKRLNALGYSLRVQTVVPQDPAQIQQLKNAQADLDKIGTPSTSPAPIILLDGMPYDEAMLAFRKPSTGSEASLIGSGLSGETALNAASPPSSLFSKGVHDMTVSGGKSGDWEEEVSGFGFYFKCALNLSGSCQVDSSQYAKSLSNFNASITADAGAELFSQKVDVLHADATYSGSDKSGKVHVSSHLGVLGSTIWQDDVTQDVGYSDGHTWSQSFDESTPAITIPCSICSIGVQAGVSGSAGITVGYKLFTSRVDGFVTPYLTCQAYFKAGGGIDLGIASADIGVSGNLTLINDTCTVQCNAGINYDHGFHFKDDLKIINSLYGLSGNVSVYASAQILGIGPSITIPIISWSGLSSNSILYHNTQDLALPWH